MTPKRRTHFLLFLVYLSIGEVGAGTYSDQMLAERGVTMKDGMYFCASMGLYVRPYKTSEDVGKCAFAVKVQAICSTSPNTQWRSGRCFCPELNRYYGDNPNENGKVAVRINYFHPVAKPKLDAIKWAVAKGCPKFITKDRPFGRSVALTPLTSVTGAGFIIKKLLPHLSLYNGDDYPGEQGNPDYPARIGSVLDMGLGFECQTHDSFKFPSVNQLISNVTTVVGDVGFFTTEGELTGRKYLEEFIAGRLPIAKFEENGDATFFLHDLDFHVMGFLLLPKKVRELAQMQTKYLLDFIDAFKVTHPVEWAKPEFKLMMEKLIEDQIARIDLGTGQLTMHVYNLLENEISKGSLLAKISKMKREKKSDLHAAVMRITGNVAAGTEELSVKTALEKKANLALRAFEESDKEGQEIYRKALEDYILRKSGEPDFVDGLKIDSYTEMRSEKARHYRVDGADLFVERIEELERLKNGQQ